MAVGNGFVFLFSQNYLVVRVFLCIFIIIMYFVLNVLFSLSALNHSYSYQFVYSEHLHDLDKWLPDSSVVIVVCDFYFNFLKMSHCSISLLSVCNFVLAL